MRVHEHIGWRCACVCVAVLVALSLTSCGKDSKTGPKDEGCCAPDTPDNLMTALACVIEDKDLDGYESLLHEGYLFTFLVEVADSLGLAPDSPWWGKTKDVHSTANLFADETARLTVAFAATGPGWTPTLVDRGGSEFSGFTRRFVPDIKLVLDEPGGEPMTIIGDETFLDVVVVSDPLYAGRYVVLEMEEVWKTPVALALGIPISLSEIKATYE